MSIKEFEKKATFKIGDKVRVKENPTIIYTIGKICPEERLYDQDLKEVKEGALQCSFYESEIELVE